MPTHIDSCQSPPCLPEPYRIPDHSSCRGLANKPCPKDVGAVVAADGGAADGGAADGGGIRFTGGLSAGSENGADKSSGCR